MTANERTISASAWASVNPDVKESKTSALVVNATRISTIPNSIAQDDGVNDENHGEVGNNLSEASEHLAGERVPEQDISDGDGEGGINSASGYLSDEDEEEAEFEPFPLLPLEIRLTIWRLTFPQGRLFSISIVSARFQHHKNPLSLSVNAESRAETLRFYTPLLVCQNIILVSLAKDFFVIPPPEEALSPKIFDHDKSLLQKIQNPLFDVTHFSDPVSRITDYYLCNPAAYTDDNIEQYLHDSGFCHAPSVQRTVRLRGISVMLALFGAS